MTNPEAMTSRSFGGGRKTAHSQIPAAEMILFL
jgi:hypothetical protein